MTTKPLSLVVLISGNGSTLQAIIDAIATKRLTAEIGAVISNRKEAYGLQRAQRIAIPTQVVTANDYPDREAYDQALQKVIDHYQPSLIILAGFLRILGANFIKHYQGRIINIHPSLLPKYRGLHTHEKVLAAGDPLHGSTVHFATEELDGGPIILQAPLEVRPSETLDSLTARVHQLEHSIYPTVIQWFAEGRLQLIANRVQLDGHILPVTGYQATITLPPD